MTVFVGLNTNDNITTTDDVFYGLDGDDYMRSNFVGLNYMEGGRGNDLLSLGDGGIAGQFGRVDGGLGGDYIVGGQGGDNLYGGDDNDIIIGGR